MGKHLSLSDRAIIEKLLAQDYTFAYIARQLGRSSVCISKEVKSTGALRTAIKLPITIVRISEDVFETIYVIARLITGAENVVNFAQK